MENKNFRTYFQLRDYFKNTLLMDEEAIDASLELNDGKLTLYVDYYSYDISIKCKKYVLTTNNKSDKEETLVFSKLSEIVCLYKNNLL